MTGVGLSMVLYVPSFAQIIARSFALLQELLCCKLWSTQIRVPGRNLVSTQAQIAALPSLDIAIVALT
jgi:hypothetical protein